MGSIARGPRSLEYCENATAITHNAAFWPLELTLMTEGIPKAVSPSPGSAELSGRVALIVTNNPLYPRLPPRQLPPPPLPPAEAESFPRERDKRPDFLQHLGLAVFYLHL
ncbi:hypothetical protein K0M31_010034 [Melipona bicolor]|uniref:Uncharacterized protein n=1 Tax=Melipona bicolor TaxID=60889 RepID=A0AA40KIT7_9HYME|nr:hypothetical protein K0M31_010034 [Melipona bicolor]